MKSGTRVWAVWTVALALPFAAAAVPGTASACGTAVRRAVEPSAQLVAKAEQSLSDGNYATAVARSVTAFPALKLVKPGQVPLADRALRIVALASVRSNGGIGPTGSQTTDATERGANLMWSIGALRGLNEKRENNPSLQTDLGEALSKVPSLHAEAQKILGELADKDLLTTAEGYAALAALRAETGDGVGRAEALKRCETMAQRPAVCTAPAAVSTGTT